MEKFIIELKDHTKRNFLLELLTQLDFIDLKIKKEDEKEPVADHTYDFFSSAGLFANRDVDANQLRKRSVANSGLILCNH